MTATLDRAAFFARVRAKLFGGHLSARQVSGMEALLDACPVDLETDGLAYCLATAFHETARTMRPIEEYGRGRGHPYGLPDGPWHQVYDGRGDVQLTWRSNYAKATRRLRALGLIGADQDLERTPDLALQPDLAAAILFVGMTEGWFTGRTLADYFGPGRAPSPVQARRIVNGLDCAAVIAGYFRAFRAALIDAAHAPGAVTARIPTVPVEARPLPAPAAGAPGREPTVRTGGVWAALRSALSARKGS